MASASSWRVHRQAQLYDWDCGLACTYAILRTCTSEATRASIPSYDQFLALQREHPAWTIDLAFVVAESKARFELVLDAVAMEFYTTLAAANPEHASESFYASDFASEAERVNARFTRAREERLVQLHVQSVASETLIEWVESKRKLIICLVDYRVLCAASGWKLEEEDDDGQQQQGYLGHFVVLCGFDRERECFECMDPNKYRGSDDDFVRVGVEALDKARRAAGTDEDLLVVSRVSKS